MQQTPINIFEYIHPHFKNVPTKFYTPLDFEAFQNQFIEIFDKTQEHYKQGVWKEDMTVIDIGANMGLSAIYFAPHAKTVYAIEPSQANFHSLEENVKAYPNIKIFEMGIGEDNKEGIIRTNGVYGVPESVYGSGTIAQNFTMKRLDTFMQEQNITHVDTLKIDCEGYEYRILQSKGFAAVADKIDCIIGEAHYFDILIPEFIPLILKEYGFTTKFLPYQNMFKTMKFTDDKVDSYKEYTCNLNTIFIAKR